MSPKPIGVLCLVLLAAIPVPGRAQAGRPTAWDSLEQILKTPAVEAAGYHRYNFPRRDITLRVRDVTVSPALALGSWAGFAGQPTQAVMMGDLVLTAAELGPVLAELARQGIDVTAIHNHLAGEEPQITYVHFHARGEALDLGSRLDRALALTATPRPVTAPPPPPLAIDTASVFRALGLSGRAQANVAQVSVVLVPGTVTLDGRPLTAGLAYGSPVNVQMVGNGRAVATGDLAVLGSKVDPVLDALASHGITATAVHTHLIGEVPKIYYIHFWADGTLRQVTQGLRAALDAGR